jgi:hypothetical protein
VIVISCVVVVAAKYHGTEGDEVGAVENEGFLVALKIVLLDCAL